MVPRSDKHAVKLEALGLKWGMTEVVQFQGKVYGWGDLQHCPREDIEHNLRVMSKMRQKERLARLSKDFDSGLYKDKTLNLGQWCNLMWGVLLSYEEPVFALDEDGNITGTIAADQVEAWAGQTGRSTEKAAPYVPQGARPLKGQRKDKTEEPGVQQASMF